MGNELNRIIDEIEDYIGGNVEGVETIDRMGLTVFLRAKLNEAYRLGQESLRKDAERLDFCERHVDGINTVGSGAADDKWWQVIFQDGNRSEAGTLRDALDEARSARAAIDAAMEAK